MTIIPMTSTNLLYIRQTHVVVVQMACSYVHHTFIKKFVSSMVLGGSSIINIKPFNIHTWVILDSGTTSLFLVTIAPK